MRRWTSKKRDALGKALQVLSWIVDDSSNGKEKGWGVRELAEELRLSPATVHRVLISLTKHGLVQRSDTSGKYQIGMEFYRLALRVQSNLAFRNAGMPVMQGTWWPIVTRRPSSDCTTLSGWR